MDKRAAFEAWRAERYAQTTSWCNELGEYPDEFTQGQWKAWKGALAAQPAASAEPSDEEIDAIAASMPDGAGGMLKQWGYRQFARALLSRYGRPAGDAKPVAWRYQTPTGWHATTDAGKVLAIKEHHPVEALYAAPVAAQKADDAALRAIAGYSNPGEGAMTAANMREIARKALSALPLPPPPPPSIPYRKVESGVVKPSRGAPVATQKADDARDAERYRWLVDSDWYVGPPPEVEFGCAACYDHNAKKNGVSQAIDAAIAQQRKEGK